MVARTCAANPVEQRTAELELELEAFSYIVSHDLAASFRHVAQFSRLLLGELGDDLTGRQEIYAGHIRVATDRCQLMMEQLLVFSRAQQKALQMTRQDATPIMRLAMCRSGSSEDAGAELGLDPLGEVWGDAALLTTVFGHLIDNAVKFRRPGVRPRIRVEPAHDQAFWRMRVIDNGVGVAPGFQDKAFRMFHRLNGEDDYPGVGAGLAICRRIARRHGGDVGFLDCDEGACVELSLPHAPAPG